MEAGAGTKSELGGFNYELCLKKQDSRLQVLVFDEFSLGVDPTQ
jgi:hypothetical protein